MSSKTPRRGSLPRVRIKKAFNEGDVGYGRPPRTHQFKPGQSGNPKGRPKGAKNEATILNELLHRKIPIREGSRTRKIMVLEAILLRFTEDSLKSNTKSAAFLLNRHGALVAGEPQPSEITEDDREILSAFAESARHQEDDVMTREDQVLLDAVLRNDFLSFLRRCMATLNPGAPFLPNWHLDAIAYQLCAPGRSRG